MVALEPSSVDTPLGRVSFGAGGEGDRWVLLHSLLTDRNAFDRIVKGLDGRVISFDLPGFGETSQAPPRIEEHADLMAAAIRGLADGGGTTLIGNGLGSFVALALAVRHPDLVDRLILLGCGAAFPYEAKPALDGMIDAVRSGGMDAVTPTALLRIFTQEYLDAHPDEVVERSEVLARTDPEAFITACTALRSLDLSARATTVTSPTLLVVGEDDQATPPSMAETLRDLIPGATLVTMPGIAHAPQLQAPDGLLELIANFCEGV